MMISKSKCIEYLKWRREREISIEYTNLEPDVKLIIGESETDEDAYAKVGEALCVSDTSFSNIYFREDCYDYLRVIGFKHKKAFKLMEIIRKGCYRFEKNQIKSNKLPDEFCEWAKGVKYLPSRMIFKDMLRTKTIFKLTIIDEFDSFYYKKLKKSMPEKIANGEIEWIYAYGDKLIARGNKSVFEAVKNIVETKRCENPFIEQEKMYKRCEELYNKYKNKKFWFTWFK